MHRCYVVDGGGRVLIGTNFLNALTQADSSVPSLQEVSLSDVEPDLASALILHGFLLQRTVFVTVDGLAPANVSRYIPDPNTTPLSGRQARSLLVRAHMHKSFVLNEFFVVVVYLNTHLIHFLLLL